MRSNFVFVSQLKALKGSDASNAHDEEPAEDEVEFSDDEAEREHKRNIKDRCVPVHLQALYLIPFPGAEGANHLHLDRLRQAPHIFGSLTWMMIHTSPTRTTPLITIWTLEALLSAHHLCHTTRTHILTLTESPKRLRLPRLHRVHLPSFPLPLLLLMLLRRIREDEDKDAGGLPPGETAGSKAEGGGRIVVEATVNTAEGAAVVGAAVDISLLPCMKNTTLDQDVLCLRLLRRFRESQGSIPTPRTSILLSKRFRSLYMRVSRIMGGGINSTQTSTISTTRTSNHMCSLT